MERMTDISRKAFVCYYYKNGWLLSIDRFIAKTRKISDGNTITNSIDYIQSKALNCNQSRSFQCFDKSSTSKHNRLKMLHNYRQNSITRKTKIVIICMLFDFYQLLLLFWPLFSIFTNFALWSYKIVYLTIV